MKNKIIAAIFLIHSAFQSLSKNVGVGVETPFGSPQGPGFL